MNGWIKLHRAINDHWIAQDPNMLAVWIRLLTEANFKDNTRIFNGSKVVIKRGQLVFGLNAFSAKSGVSIAKLRRILDMLESESMISRQKTNKYSIISITCYDQYQLEDSQDASKQQADDKQIATPKEGKEGKEGKEVNTSAKADPIPYSGIAELYNDVCTNLPKVLNPSNLNNKRKTAIRKLWNTDKSYQNSAYFERYFLLANKDPFLTGNNDRGWRADLEFLMRIDKHDKIMEMYQ